MAVAAPSDGCAPRLRRPAWALGAPLEARALAQQLHAKAQALKAQLPRADAARAPECDARRARGVSVGVRVRPSLLHEIERYGSQIPGSSPASFAQFDYEACLVERASGSVHLLSEKRKLGAPTGELESTCYSADHVFGDLEDDGVVFNEAVRPLVEFAVEGGESCLLLFGQTGAGKTHTAQAMQQRAVAAFLELGDVELSFYEIFGDRCFDLLDSVDTACSANCNRSLFPAVDDVLADISVDTRGIEGNLTPLQLRDTESGGLQVCGLRQVKVSELSLAEALLKLASTLRATAPTTSNDRSSRSHAVFRIAISKAVPAVEMAPNSEAGVSASKREEGSEEGPEHEGRMQPVGAVGSLTIVDLAGSERREDMLVHDSARLAESKAISTSLMALKNCVRNQREAMLLPRADAHARQPGGRALYRQSKLTRILRPFLVGGEHSALCVLTHLAPPRSAGKHSASSLDFVGSLCGVTRAAMERQAFNSVERWSATKVVEWVATLEGGKYAHLACCFAGMTGKLLAVEWIVHIVKRVRAQGGSEADAHAIYDAFHELHQAAKLKARGQPPVAGSAHHVPWSSSIQCEAPCR